MTENQFDNFVYHSGLIAQGCWDKFDDWDKQALRRFGNLIVKDCIDTLQERFMGDLNREDQEVRRCIETLQKHFGVAE
jgi:hypothetical protein